MVWFVAGLFTGIAITVVVLVRALNRAIAPTYF